MKRILTAVAVVMAILTCGAGAWANTYNDHVAVSSNGVGDVLVYPLFVAAQGWDTTIKVINTSTTQCVVAKLIVRSSLYSEELLDFLIFLSPADMWVGSLVYGASGPEMYSIDSSALKYDPAQSAAPFVTAADPMHQPLIKVKCPADTNWMGYVNVIAAWNGAVAGLGTDKQKRGLAIKAAYDAATAAGIYTTQDLLAGSMTVSIPDSGLSASMEATVLRNYRNQTKLGVGVDTVIGTLANNTLQEVEAAMSKNYIAMPFSNLGDDVTLHLFTFPTKQSLGVDATKCVHIGSPSAYFPGDGKVQFTQFSYDWDEQTVAGSPFSPVGTPMNFPGEVNIFTINATFDFGWVQYNLNNNVGANGFNKNNDVLNYTGSPVIPMILAIENGGMTMERAAGWQTSVVTGNGGIVLPQYQYTTAPVPSI